MDGSGGAQGESFETTEPLGHKCPRCYSDRGQPCRRKAHGRVYTSPCAIRQLLADRARFSRRRATPSEPPLANGIPNDELEALLRASYRDTKLKRLYRRLLEGGL